LSVKKAEAKRKAIRSPRGRAIAPLREITPAGQLDIRSTPKEEMRLHPLDTFAYEYPGRRIEINFTSSELTAICPFSDFPDFATIRLRYVPRRRCIELKSLKLYINSFREVKIFHEHVINQILEDVIAACDPLEVQIEGDFNVRGNIKTVIRASYERKSGRRRPARAVAV
jgi:7-cyano-7-deazaguanine reductase